MLTAYKDAMDLNLTQEKYFCDSFGCARHVYNYFLNRRKELYADGKRKISLFDMNLELTLLKKTEEKSLRRET